MSGGPGTGTATPGRAATCRAWSIPSASTKTSNRTGSGRRSTPPSPRSCATWSMSPTASTSTATSGSAPGSPAPPSTRRPAPGRSRQRPASGSWRASSWPPPAACRPPTCPTSPGATRSGARRTTPGGGPMRGSTSPVCGWRHRHRVVGRAVDPDHRRAGSPPHRVPAHRHLLGARPQRAAGAWPPGRGQGPLPPGAGRQPPRDGRLRRPVDARAAAARHGRGRHRGTGAPARRPLGVRRPRLRGRVHRHAVQPGGQPGRGRVRAGQDPRDRRRPRRGRPAEPDPGRRLQAPVRRQRLLRDVQPPRRPPGRHQCRRHRGHHPHRRPRQRRGPRRRRHRVRHRLRRHDRGPGPDPVRGCGRPHARRGVERGPEDLPRRRGRGLPQPVPDHRARQPLGAHQHGHLHRAPRRVDHRLPGPPASGGPRAHRGRRPSRRELGRLRQQRGGPDALPHLQLVVPRRQHPRQARVFMPLPGFPPYEAMCANVAAKGYDGFVIDGSGDRRC